MALHWIGSLEENYIIVFDNADVLSSAELEAFLPPGRGGNILITSRNSTMRKLTLPENSLEVSEMEENDAIELLLKASYLDPSSMEFQSEASKIVKELFGLALAIDQAGAYIASGATTIGDYLTKYSEHRETLLSHSEFTGASKYRSVYGTWELSYKEIQKRAGSDDPHRVNAANSAMLLLNVFPFFHHERITEEIFSYAALKEDESSSPALPTASSILDRRLLPLNKTGAWDNFIFREGIQILLSFSLIKKGPSDCVYAMHPLVHTWSRDRILLNERKQCCSMAYVTLSCSLRWNGGQPYGFRRALVTHIRANMEYSTSECNENGVSYFDDAYDKFGLLLQEQGYFKEAETLENKVLDTRQRILGVEHPDTIRAMANLAITYGSLGKYIESEKLEIQVLDARIRILGVEQHPDTIDAMANLAATYRKLGKYTEAEKLQMQVLDARNRILGVEHPNTITVMANLAATYRKLGKYTDTEKLEMQVLDARNRILGVEHPNTITAMANLATTYRKLGKYTEAEKLDIQVLDARTEILGVEHPDTMDAIANLAATYQKLGKYTEAERLQMQVLDARTRILGVEHPYTITAMANLAATYRKLGKCTEAERLHMQVLDARNRILGVEHPNTITAMAHLAATYQKLGKYTEAEKLQIQVLGARKRILGMEHPNTSLAMQNLAATLRCLGKYTEADKLVIQAQEVKTRVPGAESDSYTIATVANAQEAQETQLVYAKNTVHEEENSDLI